MIDYYGFNTGMSWRALIALEELELPYRPHCVNLGAGEQKSAEHLARNPFGKVPVIVDDDPKGGGEPATVFESGAILIYLAEKTGRLVPDTPQERADFYKWFFWIVGDFGGALGRSFEFNEEARFRFSSPGVEYDEAIYKKFGDASRDAHAQLDQRLEGREFICGDYSMIDIAAYGSAISYRLHGVPDISVYPNLSGWCDRLRARPAVQRGLDLFRDAAAPLPDYFREALFDDR